MKRLLAFLCSLPNLEDHRMAEWESERVNDAWRARTMFDDDGWNDRRPRTSDPLVWPWGNR
jgi:hypothetical protein